MKKFDKVKIKDSGELYSTYTELFVKMGFKNIELNNNYNENIIYTVFNTLSYKSVYFVAIEDDSGNQLLISKQGLKLVEETYTLTKEQLTYLHSVDAVKETIEEWFPSEFPKLEVGKWYKDNRKGSSMLLYLEEIKPSDTLGYSSYGFDMDGKWSVLMDRGNSVFESYMKLATPKEVEEALTKEAVKRGFKKGVRLNGLSDNGDGRHLNCQMRKDNFIYNDELNILQVSTNKYEWNIRQSNPYIFKDGIWAEIISEPIELTLDQVAEKFGYDVKQIKIVK